MKKPKIGQQFLPPRTIEAWPVWSVQGSFGGWMEGGHFHASGPVFLYLDSPYKTVAEKEGQKKKNLTKLNYD